MNPSADPTVAYVTQQVTATIASLSIMASTIILALQGYIHDGEIVTLLMGSVGAHLVIQKVTGQSPTPVVNNGPVTTAPATTTTVTTTPVVEVPTTTTFP